MTVYQEPFRRSAPARHGGVEGRRARASGLAGRRLPAFLAAAGACVLVACAGKPSEKVVPGGTSAPIDQGSSAESPPAQLTVVKIGDAVVAADGAPATDANGVSVQVAPEALATDSGSGKAVVSTFKMAGELADALAAQYSIDSPVYSVEADGRQDSTGRAALVFPAPNADSRLVQIIDDRYLVRTAS